MGTAKAALRDATGTTLAQRAVAALAPLCARVWLTLAPGARADHICAPAAGCDLFVHYDAQAFQGPLAALAALDHELRAAHTVLVLAVDMPGMGSTQLATIAHARSSHQADAAVPQRDTAAAPQVLAAAYSPRALAALTAAYNRGERSWRRALDDIPYVLRLDAAALGLPADAWDTVFAGVNTPEEWDAWKRKQLRWS